MTLSDTTNYYSSRPHRFPRKYKSAETFWRSLVHFKSQIIKPRHKNSADYKQTLQIKVLKGPVHPLRSWGCSRTHANLLCSTSACQNWKSTKWKSRQELNKLYLFSH